MKKKLYIGLGIFAALLLAVYLFLSFGLGSFVTKAVNRYGPQMTKTNVNLALAHVSPFSGEGTLDDLTVGNPAGWSSRNAFALKRIHVSVVPRSILTNRIVIREIVIDGPEFNYETRIVSSNIGQIVANIEGQKNNGAAEAKSKSGETLRFEIDHLLLKDGHLTVTVGNAKAVSIAMPAIELHDVGAGGPGVTSTELAAIVSRALLTDVVQSSSKIITSAVPAAGDMIKNAGGLLQGLLHH